MAAVRLFPGLRHRSHSEGHSIGIFKFNRPPEVVDVVSGGFVAAEWNPSKSLVLSLLVTASAFESIVTTTARRTVLTVCGRLNDTTPLLAGMDDYTSFHASLRDSAPRASRATAAARIV